MPKLVYHDSSGQRGTVEMGAETVLIGRAADCQIQTQDGLVSRRHARVSYDGAYWVEDNGSANGVYVGSERVQRYKLRPGDVFRCGHLEVRFEVEDMNRTAMNQAPAANLIAASQAAIKPVGPGPAPPPPPAMIFGDSSMLRGGSGRSTPSSSSVPPGPGDGAVQGLKGAAGASGVMAPPMSSRGANQAGPADPTGALRAGSPQKQSPSSASIPPPAPSPYPEQPSPAPTQMQRQPPPAPPRGFPDVSPVTNVPPRSSQSIPPPPPNEAALLRSELEGERQRRIEVERERDEAVRRADEATQQAQDAQVQANDALRKVEELSSRVTDGDSERLRRRIEQLESELKRKGGGGGGGEALRNAEAERDRLRAKVAELEARPPAAAAAAPAPNPDQEMETIRLRRKVDQLESDLRRARSGQPEDKGQGQDARVLELQAEVRRLTEERDAAKAAGESRQGSSEELEQARRRIDQLESEARRRPVGSVSDEKRMAAQRAEVESALRQLRDTERERDSLRELVSRSSAASGPAKPPQAVVDNLTTVSDGLADMRAALRAAGDDMALETLEQVRKALRQVCSTLGISIF